MTSGFFRRTLRSLCVYAALVLFSTSMSVYEYAVLKEGKFDLDKILRGAGWITVMYAWVVLHNVLLVDKFLLGGRTVRYVLMTVPAVALYAWAMSCIFSRMSLMYPGTLIYLIVFSAIGAAVFLAARYMQERTKLLQLSVLQREVEMQQLKMQLNPHFLFNSLNNIYSYNLENKTYGNDLILKLSELVRFIVEASSKDTIALEDELTFIDHYIAFEKERYGERCEIRYTRNVPFPQQPVPPLLIFPFVENAFKHGTNTIQPFVIELDISGDQYSIRVFVKNEIHSHTSPSTKIGLVNIQRRLALLFPGRHTLQTGQEGTHFIADLTIRT